MYVCLCKAVTDRQIRETISEGATTFAEIRRQLGVATQCGKCECSARALWSECSASQSLAHIRQVLPEASREGMLVAAA